MWCPMAAALSVAAGSVGTRTVEATMETVSAIEFFELLLEDAAAVEYERPVVRARADGGQLAEPERVELLALQVREAFEARRRRESELSALFDTAGDLAAPAGVDSVLTAIVRRAGQLLGTDVLALPGRGLAVTVPE